MKTKLTNEEILNLLTGRIVVALNRALVHGFRSHNIMLTKEQWSLLAVLWKEDGCSQQHLADKTFRDKPSVTRLLDNMEKDGLIIRKSDKHDRRMNHIFVTEKGISLEKESMMAVNEIVEKATKTISYEEIEHLKQTIKTIYQNIETN